MKNIKTKQGLLKRMAEIKKELKLLQKQFKQLNKNAEDIRKRVGADRDKREIAKLRAQIT
ncbi:MAG: hypothetical protein ACOZBH_04125 [Patescibacteria group bacterium]